MITTIDTVINSPLLNTMVAAPFALLLDFLIGEPKRFHPLIGFGKFANRIESTLNNTTLNNNTLLLNGIFAWVIAVIPLVILVYWVQQTLPPSVSFLLNIIVGWLAIGWKSLEEHGTAVANAFQQDNLEQARLRTSYLVSRDTTELNEDELSRATIESVLENGSDAVVSAVFYLCLFGAPGAILYRLSNTLDAMWGYRNERFEFFGKYTARTDDVLNFVPARLCALLYALCGNTKTAFKAWRAQSSTWYSPNAGVVMATGAGALAIQLGGAAIYHGTKKERPSLGYGKQAELIDIQRSINLLNCSIYLLAFVLISCACVFLALR